MISKRLLVRRSRHSSGSISNNNNSKRKGSKASILSESNTEAAFSDFFRNIQLCRQYLKHLANYKHYIVIVLVAAAVYLNSLTGELVHDDVFAILRNKDVLPSTSVAEIFQDDFWGKPLWYNTSHKSYRPLTVLTFRFNYLLSGYSPFSYHLVNVILHVVVCVVTLYTCHHHVFEKHQDALGVALLFAVHPVHSETVAGVVGRADILACLFFLLTFLLYVRNISTKPCDFPSTLSHSNVVLCVLLAGCAMLCKEHGATVLPVCAAYDVLFICRKGLVKFFRQRKVSFNQASPLLYRILLTVTGAILLLMLRLSLMGGNLPDFLEQDNPTSFSDQFLTRVLTYSYLIFCNVWLLVCPATLSYDWQIGSIPLVESIWDWRNLCTLGTFLVLCGITLKVLLKGLMDKQLILGLLFLGIPFIPATNIFMRVGFVIAERILYIPSLGFCILLVAGFTNISSRQRKPLQAFLTFLASLLLIIFALRTVVRNNDWHSRETLFRSGLATLPHNAKMHYNWANYMRDSGQKDVAIKHYQQAIKLYPNHASAVNNLAVLLTDARASHQLLIEALKINPQHVNAHFNLALSYSHSGNSQLAESHLRSALQLDPDYGDAVSNLASLLTNQGRFDEAELFHRKAIQLLAENADVHNNYGVFLMNRGHLKHSQQHFDKCLSLKRNHMTAMKNLAHLHKKTGNLRLAESFYLKILEMEPTALNLQNMGAFYYGLGQMPRAKSFFAKAYGLEPDNMDIVVQYVQVLLKLKELTLADSILTPAVEANPKHLEGKRALANVCGLQKKHEEAISLLKDALLLAEQQEAGTTVNAMMHFEMGNQMKDLKRHHEALEHYAESTKLIPTSASTYLNMGAVYHILGQYQNARDNYKQGLQLDPDNVILRENYLKLERLEEKQRKTGQADGYLLP